MKDNQYLQSLHKKHNTNAKIYQPGVIGRAWDSLIGVFSPIRAYKNTQARALISKNKRNYAGARHTPSLKEYWGAGGDPNLSIRQSRQTVADRVRQLVRDMPWMDGALESATDYRIGAGFNFKPAVVDDKGAMQRDVNKQIKDAFSRWCETASADEKYQFGDLQRIAVRQMIECGEALFIHKLYKNGDYRLLVLEPDCINDSHNLTSDDIDQGIQFEPKTNKPLQYFLTNAMDNNIKRETYAVDAKDVIHLFKQKRPWQRRGISPLTSLILLAGDLDVYISGEMSAQQMASRWLAFVTDPNAGVQGIDDEVYSVLDNLTIETLPAGKSITLAPGAERPTLGVETFQRIFLQILAVILRIPYSVISADYKQLNYNTLREIRNNTVHRLKSEWDYLERHLLNPVYRRWMDYAVLSGDLNLKGYFQPGGRWHYQKCFWLPPGVESVDVLRDIKGVLLAANNGMYDPQDWIMSQGEDPEEILAGMAEYQKLLKQYGIELNIKTSDSNIRSLKNERRT